MRLGKRSRRLTRFRVAVIGAGFSGVAAAHELLEAGFTDIVVLEKSAGPGGTWWDNRYPGAAVDTPSIQYSFSFSGRSWTRTHARQAELQTYFADTITSSGIRSRIRFNTQVIDVLWDEDLKMYEVRTSDGDVERYHGVVSAVGFLNEPNIPIWATGTSFTGAIVHSARWPADLSLAGKRVGIVGTGSTAVQIAVEAAKTANELYVFQREPNWILPKHERSLTAEEMRTLERASVHRFRRSRMFINNELARVGGRESRAGTGPNKRGEIAARKFIQEQLGDRPDLVELVTPAYPFRGKRPVRSDDFYKSLRQPNVHLVPKPVEGLSNSGVMLADGAQQDLDVLVLATGFTATNYLATLNVTGRDGTEIHKQWDGEPAAFLGLTVPNFPNFFMLYGPNTNSAPLVMFFEEQARFAARTLRSAARRGSETVEVRPTLYNAYNRWVQRKLARTVWVTTSNYFKTDSGKVVTQWPLTTTLYVALLRALRRPSSRFSRPGVADVSASAQASSLPRRQAGGSHV